VEEPDILNVFVTHNSQGSTYCRRNLQKGGVCIFVRKDQSFNKIDNPIHCAEQTLEACAIELETKSSNLRILALYRVPSANFNRKETSCFPKILL